jgi:hypothetical protein
MAERALAITTTRQGFARAICLDEAWSRLDPRAWRWGVGAIRELEATVHDEGRAPSAVGRPRPLRQRAAR